MSNRKTNGPSNAGVLATAVLALAVVGGLAYYVKQSPAGNIPHEELKPDRRPQDAAPAQRSPQQTDTAVIFTPRFEGATLHFEHTEVPVPAGEDPMVFAINEYLKLSDIADAGARLLSVRVDDGTATLNFSGQFAQTQGSMDEGTLVQGIQRTMGQFEGIRQLVFQAEGKPIESLGHLELSEPIPVIR